MQSKADDLTQKRQVDGAGAVYAHIKERTGEMYEHLVYVRQVEQTKVIRQQQLQDQLSKRESDLAADIEDKQERLQKAEDRLQQHEKLYSVTKDRSKVRAFIAAAQQLMREKQYEDADDRLVDAINAVVQLDEEISPVTHRVIEYRKRKPAPKLIEISSGFDWLKATAQSCQ